MEDGVLREPIDLAPFNGVVLGAGKEELEHLCVGSREALAHACGWRRRGECRAERGWGGAASGKEREDWAPARIYG